MAYFWDKLGFLEGGRFTALQYMSLRRWPDELEPDVVILGQFLWLPTGQHVDVETDFLASHLPYHSAIFGGVDREEDPWVFSLQTVPASMVRQARGAGADPYEAMREAMGNALTYNRHAHVAIEVEWTRPDLLAIYRHRGVDAWRLDGWRIDELLRGLLAELTGVPLLDVACGYPECFFPRHPHECQHDVFADVFTAWAGSRRG